MLGRMISASVVQDHLQTIINSSTGELTAAEYSAITAGDDMRHEMHGSLEGRLESLWEAVEKHRIMMAGKPFTATELMQAQESIWTATERLNEQAELTIKDFTRVYPTD